MRRFAVLGLALVALTAVASVATADEVEVQPTAEIQALVDEHGVTVEMLQKSWFERTEAERSAVRSYMDEDVQTELKRLILTELYNTLDDDITIASMTVGTRTFRVGDLED